MSSPDYYDISPEISAQMAVFPGDTPFTRHVALDFTRGDNLVLSAINTTLHLGAHADAPSHYHPGGESIAQRPLTHYVGPCQVIRVNLPRGERVLPRHITTPIKAERVLFCTNSYPDPNVWNGDFNALSADLIAWLAQYDTKLVGIDTPSVDVSDDAELHTHTMIYRHDMAILEGLVLTDVPEGIYHLTALPLRLRDADASPVRAVLWKP